MPTGISGLYENTNVAREEMARPTEVNEPPLTVLVDETYCMAGEALEMAYRIGQHMFALDEPKEGDLPDVRCFQDVVVRQAITLKRLNEALGCIMSKLGV